MSEPKNRVSAENKKFINQKKAVDKLFKSKILEVMGEAAIATDVQGKIVYWNKAATRLYGWTPQEVLDRNISEVTVPEIGQEKAANIMKCLRRGEIWSGEFLVKRKNGTTFPAIVTDSPVFNENGELNYIIGLSVDISEQKMVEHEISRLKERLDLAQRTAGIGVWDWNVKSGQIDWTPEMFELFGLDPMNDSASFETWKSVFAC